ncbi:hypothetical protein ACOTHJ_15315 [Achromobacter xylosoxidans]
MILSKVLSIFSPRNNAGSPNGLTLGREASIFKRDIQLSPFELCRHVAIQGRPGTGATFLMLEALRQQTAQGGGWIYLDSRADPETAKQLQAHAIAAGRETDFACLNFDTQPSDDDGPSSSSYSLLSYGTAEQVAARLLHTPAAPSGYAPGAEFYHQMGLRVLTAVIGILRTGGQPLSLQQITEALLQPTGLNCLVEGLPASDPLAIEISELKGYFPQGKEVFDGELLAQVTRGLAGRITAFTAPFAHVLDSSAPTVNMFDTLVNNKMLYIGAPVMSDNVAAIMLLKMLNDDLQCALPAYALAKADSPVRGNQLPFLIMCQDPAVYARNLYAVSAQARAFGISLWSNLHGPSRGLDMEGVLANSATKILFSGSTIDAGTAPSAFDVPGLSQKLARLPIGDFIVLRPGEAGATEQKVERGRLRPLDR